MIAYESEYYGIQMMDLDPIVHHGIKGQKWGVTNGPPYPLGAKARQRVREKAKRIREKLSGNKPKSEKRGMSDKTKARIKTGLKIAGTAAVVGAAAYGAYKLSELGVSSDKLNFGNDSIKAINESVSNAKRAGESMNNRQNENGGFSTGLFNASKASDISKQTGFKLKDSPEDLQHNIAKANPGYTGAKGDPLRNNCSHSVISWILNETGLDVKACPMSADEIDGGITPSEFRRYFKNCEFKATSLPKSTNDLECKKHLASTIKNTYGGEDSAGVFRMQTPVGGHYMGWIMKDKKVSFVDPQPGSTSASIYFKAYAQYLSAGRALDGTIDFARLDNLDVRMPYISRAVRNA